MKLLFVLCATFLLAQAAVVEQPKINFQDAQILAELPPGFDAFEVSEYGSTSWCLIVS